MLLETLMSDPDSVQKAFPHPPEGFLVFFGARRRRVGGLGRPYLRALVALGRSASHSCGAGGAEFKRLRATAGQGPNYVGPSCGDVGLCWPILRAMLAQLGAMLD